MASSGFRDLSAQEIIARYEYAKSRDPKLTQGKFFRAGTGDRFKNEESAARYFRLLKEGKRSGNVLWSESTGRIVTRKGRRVYTTPPVNPNNYQVMVRDRQGNVRSFNIGAIGGRSSFDIVVLDDEVRRRKDVLQAKAKEWAQRYGIKENDINIEDFEIRKTRRADKPYQMLLNLTR